MRLEANKTLEVVKRQGIVIAMVVVFIVFGILSKIVNGVNSFATWGALMQILQQNAWLGIMACGMTFAIIGGNFDLSHGSLMTLLCCVIVKLYPTMGPIGAMCVAILIAIASGAFSGFLVVACKLQPICGVFGAVLIALLVGLLVGCINGFFVAYMNINAFVVTLATMLGCRGVELIYAHNVAVPSVAFRAWGASRLGYFTYIALLFLVMLVCAQLVLKYTVHGRNTYASGGNKLSAFNAGINVKLTTFINFAICGFTGGLGGVVCAVQNGASAPALGWPDTHMLVIAGVVLGGTKLTGGIGNLWYTLGGVTLLGMLDKVMSLLNVPTSGVKITTGSVMILILLLDHFLKPATLEIEPPAESGTPEPVSAAAS